MGSTVALMDIDADRLRAPLHDGRDVYPQLRAKTDIPDSNRVRYELLRHFGYFCTESSEHLAEYVPSFIKSARPELIEEFNIPLDEYPRRCEEQPAQCPERLATARSDDRSSPR